MRKQPGYYTQLKNVLEIVCKATNTDYNTFMQPGRNRVKTMQFTLIMYCYYSKMITNLTAHKIGRFIYLDSKSCSYNTLKYKELIFKDENFTKYDNKILYLIENG